MTHVPLSPNLRDYCFNSDESDDLKWLFRQRMQIPVRDPSKMTKTTSKIRLSVRLFRPAASAKVGSWTFLTLPKNASAKLTSRGIVAVEGTINGFPSQST